MPAGDGQHPQRRGDRRKIGARAAAVVAGTVIFSLLVWAAFYLGFERMQADLVISHKTELTADPIVQFDAEDQGWTLVRPANTRSETGPEYGNISSAIDAMCVFTWTAGKFDDSRILDAETDEAATLSLLEQQGHDTDRYGVVRLVSESGQSIELVYVDKEATTGLDTVVAARTFAGSGDFLVFTMKCERTGELNREVLQDTLLGVEVNLDIQN